MKMEQIECSETSAYIIQTPGNYPKENVIYSEHGESLKSRIHSYISCQNYISCCSYKKIKSDESSAFHLRTEVGTGK